MSHDNLIELLNWMYDDHVVYPGRTISRHQQLLDAGESIYRGTDPFMDDTCFPVYCLGHEPCRIRNASPDGRGRSQFSMRVYMPEWDSVFRKQFRPWHVRWVAKNGSVHDTSLQYSHRCHNTNCIADGHGVWETDRENKNRDGCRSCSHVILPDGTVIKVCKHKPCCLRPVLVKSWQDPRVSHVADCDRGDDDFI